MKSRCFQACMFRENVNKRINRVFFNVCLELTQLSGIAAILRFPIPEIEDEEEEE